MLVQWVSSLHSEPKNSAATDD
uniref:Uncharacterized protein n=1 Tax=Anguilla anguilla TaxID=7936 RepID=A0A0E9SIY2_ANGAN